MPPSRELCDAAMWTERARRFLLLGRRGPWLGRAAASGIPEADAAEHGAAAVAAATLLDHSGPIDDALTQILAVRIARPGETSLPAAGALAALVRETDADERDGLARAIARALPAPVASAAAAFAACAEEATERGARELVLAADVAAGQRVLDATEDSARDVFAWATLKLGRSRRSRLTWSDAARVLRMESLDASLRPARDPWPALREWRAGLGLSTELRFESVVSGWFGSWAVRLPRQLVAGAAGWPGASLWRFALQALGRADALRDGGGAALLPADPGAAELLPSLYAALLPDRTFLDRAARVRPGSSPDDVRRLALCEVLLQRMQAAALSVQQAFETGRALDPLRDVAADAFRRALYAPLPPELGLLLCRPWAPPLASPRAALAAATLAERLRESFDSDWWRNPRSAPELRRFASLAAEGTLAALVPGGDAPAAYLRWLATALGG